MQRDEDEEERDAGDAIWGLYSSWEVRNAEQTRHLSHTHHPFSLPGWGSDIAQPLLWQLTADGYGRVGSRRGVKTTTLTCAHLYTRGHVYPTRALTTLHTLQWLFISTIIFIFLQPRFITVQMCVQERVVKSKPLMILAAFCFVFRQFCRIFYNNHSLFCWLQTLKNCKIN